MQSTLIAQYQESILDHLKEMTQPLFDNSGIRTFAYRKFFRDGRSFGISTNHEWNKWHNEHLLKLEGSIPIYENDIRETVINTQYSCFRIGEPDNRDVLCMKLHDFDIWNTLCVYKKNNDFIEGFYFAGTKENLNIINFFLNNVVDFDNYIFYLKNYFFNSINKDTIDQLLLPTILKESFSPLPNFLENGGILYKEGETILLTAREAECLHYFSQGYTIKEIAKTLNLSPRTIETFINKLKNKMGVYYKSDLIKVYFENINLKKFVSVAFEREASLLPFSEKTVYNKSISFSLSTRENECLYYLSQGYTLKEIAKTLNLSPRTIETFINKLKIKTRIYKKSELIDLYKNNYSQKLKIKYK